MKADTYEYLSDWARENIAKGRAEGQAEGKAEGKAEAILAVLAARDIQVPDEFRDKIRKCHDLERLDGWIRVAATVESADVLMDDEL
ncbi:hypothetical protein [Microbispora sp. H13382]|uniref:hypothetical protein n=1 Tax=Microbispora sp. H13382 TaxID=2729112 RepID=UPI00160397C3|nr:hypothetical protein [Microbispora sp. H13382]